MTVKRYDNIDRRCAGMKWNHVDRCGWPGTIWLGMVRLCIAHYEDARLAREQHADADSFIYFARIGDYITIGRSRNVGGRVKRLHLDKGIKRPDDLPAGALKLLYAMPHPSCHEETVHQAFETERVIGEWFHASPNLLAYIDSLIAAPEPYIAAPTERSD